MQLFKCLNCWKDVSNQPTFAFYSLRVLAILNHFGYPPPHLDQLQQCIWFNLGATQEVLHQMRNCLS